MNVLILGSGGREHAIAWKIAQSEQLNKLFVAPGNAGTSNLATNVKLSLSDFSIIAEFVSNNQIDMLIVGPEAPLVEGITDFFKSDSRFNKLKVIGPSKHGAKLEGSKEFAKSFMIQNKIPTARYKTFDASTIESAYEFLEELESPFVLKADGLAGGKGVLICQELGEAKTQLKGMLVDQKFGSAGVKVVIEEFLDGIEMSVFVLTDGKNYKILPEAKDYKRIGEGDAGLNTGGMGAISPVPFATKELMAKIEKKIIAPSVNGLQKAKMDYCGFLFIGLMIVDDEPYVIEYNVRMGDPETEVVMPRINSDFLKHLSAAASGTLAEEEIVFSKDAATAVMLVAGGYPESYEKGDQISGFDHLGDCIAFHAGTTIIDGETVTNGGRIIAVTSLGANFKDALAKSYLNADRILFKNKYYRKDIGFDLIELG